MHSVKLNELPTNLTFPAEMNGRVTYDAARKRLHFRGFMTKADYDRLAKLSNDLEYERAVQALFIAASYSDSEQSWSKLLWAAIGMASVIAALAAIWYLRQ